MNKKILLTLISFIAIALIAGLLMNRGTPTPQLSGVKALPNIPKVAILVPGHGGNKAALTELSNYLQSNNWETHILDIGSGTEDLNVYAKNLEQKINEYSQQNKSINIIGYSAGGIITRIALSNPTSASKTARVVSVASPHKGTKVADLGQKFNVSNCGVACAQLSTDSELINNLPNTVEPQNWLSLFIENDEAIRPDTNAELNGATNINLTTNCGSKNFNHGNIIKDQTTLILIEEFLYNGTITKINC
jgi:triacylglycerol lipase